ncbi:MAG: hypothetical protein ACKVX9_16680 [Blastocatellia bacterium]
MRHRLWKNANNRIGSLLIVAGFLFILPFAGCGRLAPKTTALRNIHESYRIEFQKFLQLSVPAPAETPGLANNVADQPAFAETLRMIRDYRLQHGEDSKEVAHLKVLEGMIYLQSGQTGMAQILARDIRDAQSSLSSGTGTSSRDQLLAANFGFLVNGWDTIKEGREDLEAARKLEAAADSIKKELDKLDPSKLARPEVDEGAVYIATTSAIFYTWVGKILSIQNPDKSCWCGKGSELIGRFLTKSEKEMAEKADLKNVPSGRIRYISWYGFLSKCAGTQAEGKTCRVPEN